MNEIKLTNGVHIKFKIITKNHFKQLHKTFQLSFRNYHTTINTSLSAFESRIERIGVSLNLSVAAYHNDEMVGFIIQAEDIIQGIKTAYNGGTGILPAYRGNKLSKRLYEYNFEMLKKCGFEQCILEVISENIPALKIYAQLGFIPSRELVCYRTVNNFRQSLPKIKINLQKLENSIPDWHLYQQFFDFVPSWQNTTKSILRNYENEIIIEASYKAEIIGVIIFDPLQGKISQLAVHSDFRRKGIGTQLLRAASALIRTNAVSIINVDKSSVGSNKFFLNSGFKEIITQQEMIRVL